MGLRILFVRVEQSPGFEQWTPFSSGFLVLFSHKKERMKERERKALRKTVAKAAAIHKRVKTESPTMCLRQNLGSFKSQLDVIYKF